MRSRSRSFFTALASLALLAGASGIAAALSRTPSTAQAPTRPAREAFEPKQFRAFADAVTLQQRALAGEMRCSRLLTEDELVDLQIELERLNALWHTTTAALHERMEVVLTEQVANGELAPSSGEARELGSGIIGRRYSVFAGVAYEKDFRRGDDAEVDALQRRRVLISQVGNRVIRHAFQKEGGS